MPVSPSTANFVSEGGGGTSSHKGGDKNHASHLGQLTGKYNYDNTTGGGHTPPPKNPMGAMKNPFPKASVKAPRVANTRTMI